MARAANQKLKILYILKLLERSDETHVVTMKAILGELADHGIQAERKRIYDDLDALRRFGYPIVAKRGRMAGYYLAPEGREGLLQENRLSQTAPEGGSDPTATEEWTDREAAVDREPEWLWDGDTKIELFCEEKTAENILREFSGTDRIRVKAGRKMGSVLLKFKAKPGEAFYSWLAGFGCRVKLGSPSVVIKEYRKYLKEIRNLYKEE